MVRAALQSRRKLGEGPSPLAAYVPTISVVIASCTATLPIVSSNGWVPDLGFMVLIAWRLLRSDPWPAWWAGPMGLANDLLTAQPIGFSIALWSATMLVLDLIDRRTMWRDYWIEWGLAAILLAAHEWFEWQLAAIAGAAVPIRQLIAPIALSILVFPIAAELVSRLDRWRLGQ